MRAELKMATSQLGRAGARNQTCPPHSYRAWPGVSFLHLAGQPKAKTRTPNAWRLHQTGQVCPHPGYQSHPLWKTRLLPRAVAEEVRRVRRSRA
jgi:hypothetical protein